MQQKNSDCVSEINLISKCHFQVFSNAKLQKSECFTNERKTWYNSKLGCSHGRYTLVTLNSSDFSVSLTYHKGRAGFKTGKITEVRQL